MPMQISAAVGHHISSVRVVSIPSDHYLSAQDIERARSPGIFEATAAPEPLVEPEAPAASAQEIKPYSPEEATRVAELRKLPLEELKRLAGVTDADH